MQILTNALNATSIYAIPVVLLLVLVFGQIKHVKVYEAFVDGAKDGFNTAVRIIPFLVGMLVAIGVFRASGAMTYVAKALAPVTNLIGMPSEVLPMTLMRSLSGGGANGMMSDLFKNYGADSLIGKMASVLMGSTETTLYVLAVYFGAIGIRKSRHAVAAGLIADLASALAAVFICNLMFK